MQLNGNPIQVFYKYLWSDLKTLLTVYKGEKFVFAFLGEFSLYKWS